jgi:hypothetical protein
MSLFQRAALLGLFVGCVDCSDRVSPAAPNPFPLLTGPATTYSFSASLDYKVRRFTEGSSFVLYENGSFYLWYDPTGKPYGGSYERDGGRISFYFDWHRRSATPDAFGVLKDDLLEVRYDEIMQHADFENAVYRRAE